MTTKRNEGGWGWVIVASSFFIHMLYSSTADSLGVFYLWWLDEFESSINETSRVISTCVAFTWGLGPVAAGLAYKFGYRVVCMIGTVLVFLGFFLSYFANSIPVLVLTLGVIAGSGGSFVYLPAVAIVALYFDKRRSLAVGIGMSGVGIGSFFMVPFIYWLAHEYGWRGSMLIMSGVCLNLGVCAAVMRPVTDTISTEPEVNSEYCNESLNFLSNSGEEKKIVIEVNNDKDSSEDKPCLKSTTNQNNETFLTDSSTNKKKDIILFLLFCISNFFPNLTFLMPFDYMVDRAIDSEINGNTAPFLLSAYGAGNVFGRVVFGLLADLRCVDKLIFLISCLMCCGGATCASVLCYDFAVLHGLYAFTFGCFTGAYVMLTPVVVVELVGIERVGVAYGITLFFQGLATRYRRPLAGIIFNLTGSYNISYAIYGFFIIISGTILIPISFARRRRNADAVSLVN